MGIQKIGRVNVSDAVMDEIKRLISSGEWPAQFTGIPQRRPY